MSSFGGKLREYSAVSIDKFDESNLSSTAYFLSHCHSDHMIGLGSPQLHQRLLTSSFNLKLYMSAISRAFLLADEVYAHLEPHIEALPLDEAISLKIPDETTCETEDLVVTLLPAGHCPGSVMFLFEGQEGTVLYTGDFRLATGDVAKLKNLHVDERVKSISSLYVDTTFCCPKSMHFPTREQSRDALVDVVSMWLSRSPHHVVYLRCSAQFGYEYLFVELYKHFNMKVHVSERKMKKYADVQEITEAVTVDKQATRIHACYYKRSSQDKKQNENKRFHSLPCSFTTTHPNQPLVKSIKLSVMWFAVSVTAKDIVLGKPESLYARVCFATHSSYTEIMELVRYLNPKKVFPNVIPVGSSYSEVLNRLTNALVKGAVTPNHDVQLLGSLKRPRSQNDLSSIESNLLFDSDTCSPKFKKFCPKSDSQSTNQASSQQTNDSLYVESPRLPTNGLSEDSCDNAQVSKLKAVPVFSPRYSENSDSQDLFSETSSSQSESSSESNNNEFNLNKFKPANLDGAEAIEVIDLTGEEESESAICEKSSDIFILSSARKCNSEYDSDETTDNLSGTPSSQQLLRLDSDETDINISPYKK